MNSRKNKWLFCFIIIVTFLFITLITKKAYASKKYVMAYITHYCPCHLCCGRYSDGYTSTGRKATLPGCAVDPKAIPYGSIIQFPDGARLQADDTGIAMSKSFKKGIIHIDRRFRTHTEAKYHGVKWQNVKIIKK